MGHLTTKEWVIDLLQKTLIKSNASCTFVIPRWLRFDPDNKKGLKILAGTRIKNASGKFVYFSKDTAVDLTSQVTANGTDYFVFMANDGTITASTTATPADGQVKIGRFHTLCVDAGTITMIAPAGPSSGLKAGDSYLVKPYKEDEDPDFYAFYKKAISQVTAQTYYDVVTCSHPLSGFKAGEILPESVFCLSWHPDTLYEDAMVYDKTTDKCIDIYLQSGTGFNTRSAYGKTHTVNRQSINHSADMAAVGKNLLTDFEFLNAALGSNECTNITGSKDQTTVGGHVDTAGRRMISAIGAEEMCGYIWQWLDEVSNTGAYNLNGYDGHNNFGQEYGVQYVLSAGGSWNNGSLCGSRVRDCYYARSTVDLHCGGRGSSRVIREAKR